MPGGCKGKFHKWLEPEGLLQIEGWAKRGLTDKDIADNMGINVGTLYEWKKRFPKISESLKNGKEVADIIVENALFNSATGREEYDEVTTERIFDQESGKYKMVETKRVHKKIPASVTAQIFWLKNRRPDLWRDKQDLTVAESGVVAIIDDLGMNNDGKAK